MEKLNLTLTPEVFRFSSTQQEVTSLLLNNEPWFVAKDVCNILDLENVTNALSKLDTDEKLPLKILRSGQKRKVNCVNESGLYALILRSNKPEARIFRKWVTSEVLPAIRRKGFYGQALRDANFVDARDIPYESNVFNGIKVRCVKIGNEYWYSVNDVHRSIGSRTSSYQVSKRLNEKQQLARKIWLFGNTHPAWFTNMLGLQLIASGSRVLSSGQLKLNLFSVSIEKEGGIS